MNHTRAVKEKKGKKMKKIVLMMIAMMSMTVAFAENGDENKDAKKAEVADMAPRSSYNMSMNYDKLAHTLRLDEEQMVPVALVHNRFVRNMRKAADADANLRERMVKKAANREFAEMSYILTRDQMDTFRAMITATLENRGLVK